MPEPITVQGFSSLPVGESHRSKAASLMLGPVSSRGSSLTHVSQPVAPPQSTLTAFYPDFLRRRITPARHEVVSEEADKELLSDAGRRGVQSATGNYDTGRAVIGNP